MRCPNCSSTDLVRHGRRRTLQGPVQVHLCKGCGKTSSDRPIRYLNTRSILVLRGVSLYNQGYSLGQCSNMLKEAFRENVPRNTIHYWTKRYRDVFPYLTKRRKDEPKLPLVTRRFDAFTYSYHRRKVIEMSPALSPLRDGILGSGRVSRPIVPVARSKEELPEGTGPFRTEGATESRIASLVERADENEVLRAILINDALTVCRNLPVARVGDNGLITYDPIPLLQVRGRKVRLLSFLTASGGDGTAAVSLLSKAKALSATTGLPESRFEIGWFDTEKVVHYDLSLKKHY